MNPTVTIGAKVKALRKKQEMTLKQLSEKTELSVGFLSQLERGISNIAIDSLNKIANALGVNISTFFQEPKISHSDPIIHSYDLPCRQISLNILQYILSNNVESFNILPRLYVLMPSDDNDDSTVNLELYGHIGEEFIFVLEGVVTVFVGDNVYSLYPGDGIQIHSKDPHNWTNRTNRIAKILTINYPNPLRNQENEPTP
ncbi:helix-turn-helix domain-containing protein [Caproicibacterium sp. BJN0003]|uniref:helix-turn-helix domain-containing protein n=1 Tax=Caproicibacterium sp. BJN0003 TaxID=2994078 RepID=UPI00225AD50A|nr:XRE family transcriptional regulator [Caproicibacterium sp. BJN0003]UZT81923.1 XRE family transcriptional regulator [Caproicibacterium sp. BJN0003]